MEEQILQNYLYLWARVFGAKPRLEVTNKRAIIHKPCACGRTYFAKGLCRRCYAKNYNKKK